MSHLAAVVSFGVPRRKGGPKKVKPSCHHTSRLSTSRKQGTITFQQALVGSKNKGSNQKTQNKQATTLSIRFTSNKFNDQRTIKSSTTNQSCKWWPRMSSWWTWPLGMSMVCWEVNERNWQVMNDYEGIVNGTGCMLGKQEKGRSYKVKYCKRESMNYMPVREMDVVYHQDFSFMVSSSHLLWLFVGSLSCFFLYRG